MTEKEKFLAQLAKDRENGLENIKFAFDHDSIRANKPTEEDVYGELNRMWAAEDVEDERFDL